MLNDILAQIREIRKDIRHLDAECEEAEYTDTGDAWDLIDRIYVQLGCILEEASNVVP